MTEEAETYIETEGKYRVGVTFNPSAQGSVDEVKQRSAELIDLTLKHGRDTRCTELAMTKFEEACMWAVKSMTKPSRD